MLKRRVALFVAVALVVVGLWGNVNAAYAVGETFEVISIDNLGCASGDFEMTIEKTNLDGADYTIHTVVNSGGLIYMNEDASVSDNGFESWRLFDLFNYGAVANPGTWPIPAGQELVIDFTVERPKGTVLYAWTLIVDGCDTGNISYNGLTSPISASGACNLNIPSGSVVGEAPLGAQIYYAPAQATNLTLNPGTYIVVGQDASETYYKIILACQFRWVRKDSMQPSYQAPQNGAPLPLTIVS